MAEIINIHSGEHKLMLLRNHDTDMEIFIEDNASLKFFDLANSIKSIKSEICIAIHFEGENSELLMRGRMQGKDTDSILRNILIDHKTPSCKSDIYYKYVLNDDAQGSFTGKVLVRQDSQKTESLLLNRNLCLTKTAHMHSEPLLEIYADDVKCSHGSSIGMLDENALFYMQQRGISLTDARRLLIDAFINEIQMPRLCIK
ncbi:MAG: SufD family Fe-S cluster assembly protein [Prevotellaceae bacterium]|nr:SufD family Fe-S cluster assembly protein [Candidatus Colivivens equi]